MALLHGMYRLLHGGGEEREDGKFRRNKLKFS